MQPTFIKHTVSRLMNTKNYLKPKVEPAGYVAEELANDIWQSITTTRAANLVAYCVAGAIHFYREATTDRISLTRQQIISEIHQLEKSLGKGTGHRMQTEGEASEDDST